MAAVSLVFILIIIGFLYLLAFSTGSALSIAVVVFFGLFFFCDCFVVNLVEKNKNALSLLALLISGIMILGWYFVIYAFTGNALFNDKIEMPAKVIVIVLMIIPPIFIYWKYQRAKRGKLLLQKIASHFIQEKNANTNLSAADELMKWKQLYDDGTITEEMFNKKRDELLRR